MATAAPTTIVAPRSAAPWAAPRVISGSIGPQQGERRADPELPRTRVQPEVREGPGGVRLQPRQRQGPADDDGQRQRDPADATGQARSARPELPTRSRRRSGHTT